jgi:diadenosine tetraphosphate (Ap4A) HIT family hydrolase
MTLNTDHIHPQLLADSHPLGRAGSCHIRLHKNACVPWVILIPETDCTEFCDLSEARQLEITRLSRIISDWFKAALGAEKINFAAIGNVVQQLHIHVIGRHRQDPFWPDVMWGQRLPELSWQDNELLNLQQQLSHRLVEAGL